MGTQVKKALLLTNDGSTSKGVKNINSTIIDIFLELCFNYIINQPNSQH